MSVERTSDLLEEVVTKFNKLVARVDALEHKLGFDAELDPICDCYARSPNDCFRWNYCKQRIK